MYDDEHTQGDGRKAKWKMRKRKETENKKWGYCPGEASLLGGWMDGWVDGWDVHVATKTGPGPILTRITVS